MDFSDWSGADWKNLPFNIPAWFFYSWKGSTLPFQGKCVPTRQRWDMDPCERQLQWDIGILVPASQAADPHRHSGMGEIGDLAPELM